MLLVLELAYNFHLLKKSWKELYIFLSVGTREMKDGGVWR